MPDLEFLPDWYPKMRGRRRRVIAQAWISIVFLIALTGWVLVIEQTGARRDRELAAVEQALSASRRDLSRLEELLVLEKQLLQQEQILRTVGPHVEAARLFTALDEVMPREMALLEMTFQTEDRKPELKGLAAATKLAAPAAASPSERLVKVRLSGVAPSDVDLANFLTRLTGKPMFSGVTLTYAKDRRERGYVMREFEVLFTVNLGSTELAEATGIGGA